MEQVTDLLALAAEPDVGQRAPKWWASIQWVNTPWSTLPICQGPAITPQRSITAGTPRPARYSSISSSAASLVAP